MSVEVLNNPLVSVIIPVYNCESYLEACLQSVVSQSYHNLEIIVVNDGSIDASPDIIQAFASNDLRFKIVNKTNAGLPLARKSGLDIATGKYVQHLDGDDLLIDGAIEKLVARAESTGADIVAARFIYRYTYRDDEESILLGFDELNALDYYRLVISRKANWSLCFNFQRRSLYTDNAIVTVPDISMGEDAILMTQVILHAKTVVSLNEFIIVYNRYETSMSDPHNITDARYIEFRKYIAWIEQYLENKGLAQVLDKEIAEFYIYAVFESIYWKRFDYLKSDMKRVVRAVKKYPELLNTLGRRQKKIIKVFGFSSWLGYLNVMRYSRRETL